MKPKNKKVSKILVKAGSVNKAKPAPIPVSFSTTADQHTIDSLREQISEMSSVIRVQAETIRKQTILIDAYRVVSADITLLKTQQK